MREPITRMAAILRLDPFSVLGASATVLMLAACQPTSQEEQQSSIAVAEQLFWVDRAGNVGSRIGEAQALITSPVLSPDGRHVLVRAQDTDDDTDDIWIHAVEAPTKMRVTSSPSEDKQPDWSPTGDQVVFYSYRNGLADLYIAATDGSRPDQPLVMGADIHEYGPTWSPDGKTIVFHTHDPETDRRELMYISSDGSGQPMSFLPGAAGIAMPRFSPDGRYIAYVSDESGQWEVYVRAFPAGQVSWRISTDGGMWPKWSGDAGELFFYDGTDVMAVSIRHDPFQPGNPRRLFSAAEAGMRGTISNAFNPLFDAAADGQRFVVVGRAR